MDATAFESRRPLDRVLLRLVLDAIVPAGDGFPSAGDAALDHVLNVASGSPDVERAIAATLEAVAAASPAFASLDAAAREALLRRVEAAHPDAFGDVIRQAYFGYYGHADVVTRLGLEPGPIHPRGHRLDDGDVPDLSHVTSRGPVYRPT